MNDENYNVVVNKVVNANDEDISNNIDEPTIMNYIGYASSLGKIVEDKLPNHYIADLSDDDYNLKIYFEVFVTAS